MDRDHDTAIPVAIPPSATAPAVFAVMPTGESLDAAIKALETAGFDRADLSLPEIDPPPERDTPEAGAKAPDTDIEAQQARVMHSGVGGAAVVIAGAAIGSGLAVGAAANAISRAFSNEEQADRDRKIAAGKLVLSVRAPTPDGQTRARDVLRAVGAVRVW